MKNLKTYISAGVLLLMAAGLSACNEEFAQPPVTIPVEGEGVHVGNGTWDDPLQVWQAHLGTNVDADGRQANWVTGYIVGFINNNETNSFSSAVITEGTAASVNGNVLLAQYPYDEEEWEKIGYKVDDCIAVQLVSGGCRGVINLSDNPANFNKLVSLRGITGKKYMGAYGLRSCYEYMWGDKGRYEEPKTEIEGEYFCNFSASRDISYYTERGWNTFVETGGLSGWYVRESGTTRYVTCSAYYGTATGGPYKMWIISPALKLKEVEQKTVSFRSQVSSPQAHTSLKVYAMTEQNPKMGEIQQLEAVISTSNNTWTSSGDIDLSQFENLNNGVIYIGFLYDAEEGGNNNSPNYNMTDFNFGGANPADWEIVDPASIGTFRKATELQSGRKYALEYDYDGISYIAGHLGETEKYGWFPQVEVPIMNDEFSGKKDNAILFTYDEEGDGWVLTDAYERVIYLDPSLGSSFELSSAGVMPEINYLWSVEPAGDGAYKITNITQQSVIEYSDRYNNFTINKPQYVTGMNPTLYELVEN